MVSFHHAHTFVDVPEVKTLRTRQVHEIMMRLVHEEEAEDEEEEC